MALDPSIILKAGQQTEFPQFNIGNAAITGDHLVGLQNNLLALRQNQQKVAGQNALRGILSQPGAMDQNGVPTPEAMQQVAGVDPSLAMQLHQNALVTQEHQAQMAEYQTRRAEEVQALVDPARAAALKAYTDTNGPPEAKMAAGQKALSAGLDDVVNGGGLSDAEKTKLNRKFDPIYMGMMSDRWQQYQKNQAALAKDAREEEYKQRELNERVSHDHAVENKPIQATDPDNNNMPYLLYLNGPGGKPYATTLGGQPYTPKGMAKVGSGNTSPAAAAEHDAQVIANQDITDEEREIGHPLSDARKAEIRRARRIDPKIQEAQRKLEVNAISDEAADLIAAETLKGDWHATVGMGRNQFSMKKIAEARSRRAKELGLSGDDLAANTAEFTGLMAAERVLGTRSAGIGLGIAEANQFGPMVLEQSAKIDRSDFPTINSMQLAVERGTGGEDVVRLVDAINAYKTAYAQVLSRGGVPTDDARRRSDEVIDKAWSDGQIKATIDQLGKEMEGAESAVPAVRNRLYRTVTGRDRPTQPAAGASVADKSGGGATPAATKTDQATTGQGAPAVPDWIKAKSGWQWNPDRQMARDPAGNLYDAKGAPIKGGQATAQPAKAAPPAPTQSNVAGQTRQTAVPVTTLDEALKLPPGTYWKSPDGKVRQRPKAAPTAVATN